MPFDGTYIDAKKLKLMRLIDALRTVEIGEQPLEDTIFMWNYRVSYCSIPPMAGMSTSAGWRCGTMGCAIGLGSCLGLFAVTSSPYAVASSLGILEQEAVAIFYSPTTYGFDEDTGYGHVSAGMVADKLAEFL